MNTASVNQEENTENGNLIESSHLNHTTSDESTLTNNASDIILQMIQSEYNIEASRKRDIETRAGVLIALLGALIGFYATAIDFSIFKKANSQVEYFCFVMVTFIYITPFATFILSMKRFIEVLQTKTYKRIGLPNSFISSSEMPRDELSIRLAESYRAVVKDNGLANDEKAAQFKSGVSLMYVSLIGIIIAFSIKQIISLII